MFLCVTFRIFCTQKIFCSQKFVFMYNISTLLGKNGKQGCGSKLNALLFYMNQKCSKQLSDSLHTVILWIFLLWLVHLIFNTFKSVNNISHNFSLVSHLSSWLSNLQICEQFSYLQKFLSPFFNLTLKTFKSVNFPDRKLINWWLQMTLKS